MRGSKTRNMAPTFPHCVWSLPPEGARLAWGGPALRRMAPTFPHCVWSLDVPQPEATSLCAVRMCAGTSRAAALSPKGARLAWGGPALRRMY